MSEIRNQIPRSSSRHIALVLGRLLGGGHHGLYAHDLAHLRDLGKSVEPLKGSGRETDGVRLQERLLGRDLR